MAIADVTYKNKVLDACYGSGRATAMPATVYIALFTGDPTSTGVELTSGTGGYTRTSVANDTTHWPLAASGQKSNGLEIAFPVSTGAWSGTATYWCIMSASTAGEKMDYATLTSPLTVSASGVTARFAPGALQISE